MSGPRRSYPRRDRSLLADPSITEVEELGQRGKEGIALESEAADEFIICGARVDARLMPRIHVTFHPRYHHDLERGWSARNRRTCNGSDPLDKAIKTYHIYVYVCVCVYTR